MLEAVVPLANPAGKRNQFFLFAGFERTSIGVDFLPLRFAKLVNVGPDGHIWGNVPCRRNWLAAQRTNWNLDVLLVRRMAGMCLVAEVLRATQRNTNLIRILIASRSFSLIRYSPENLPTSVAFHWQEI